MRPLLLSPSPTSSAATSPWPWSSFRRWEMLWSDLIWSDVTKHATGCLHHPTPGPRPQGEGGWRREEEAGAGVQVEEAAEGERGVAEGHCGGELKLGGGLTYNKLCLLQKDRKIGILRKHIAMKREVAQREQERLRRDTEIRQRETEGYNGTCR